MNVSNLPRFDVVSVVGGGWSFGEVDHHKLPGHVVAVNEAVIALEKAPDVGISMDRMWVEHRWSNLYLRPVSFYARKSSLQNVPRPLPTWCKEFDCDHTTVMFSWTLDRLNGTNSGTCALNYAYLMSPDTVYLFGFDMQRGPDGRAYWHAPYPWAPVNGATKDGKYQKWAREFERIKMQFEMQGTKVINVSSHSAIKCFKTITPKQLGVAK
jgi:hypothetical protein